MPSVPTQPPPIISIPHQSAAFVTVQSLHRHIIVTPSSSFTLGLMVGVAHSMGFPFAFLSPVSQCGTRADSALLHKAWQDPVPGRGTR